MTGRVVLALYRPNEGKAERLLEILADHVPTLRRLELATDREVLLLRATDGTVIEIFEWVEEDSARVAHEHPEVARVWEAIGQCAEFTKLGDLEEATLQFPHFDPVDLPGAGQDRRS